MEKQKSVGKSVRRSHAGRLSSKLRPLAAPVLFAILLLSLAPTVPPRPVFAHGVQCYVNGLWFNGRVFESKTVYSVEGVFRTDYAGKADNTIDLKGRHIIPPFAEAHNHHFGDGGDIQQQIKTYLSQGIFYARNTNSTEKLTGPLRKFVNLPESVEVLYSYGGLTAPGGHPIQIYDALAAHIPGWTPKEMENQAYYVVDSEGDLDRKWSMILSRKPDFIKAYLEYSEEYEARKNDHAFFGKRGLDPRLLPKIVRRAHKDGLRVAVHINTAADFRNAVRSGADEIAHLPLERLTAEDAKAAADRGVVVVTTTLSHRPTGHVKDVDGTHRHNLALLHRARVRLAAGTDDNNRTVLDEAENVHRLRALDTLSLLKLLVEVTPQTIFPARKIGRLESGYEASFLALDGNPLEDFAFLRKVSLRVKRGHMLEIAPDPPKKPSVASAIAHTLMRDGVAAAISEYRQLRREQFDAYDFSEQELNRLGYELLKQQRVADAIEVFKLNVEMFPNAFNTYDSLGEAYLKAGNQELAARNYRKSLELNPHNVNAAEMLKKIQ
ncbi:MAG: tetratricopeptide repeat protein [Acidobacteria bacterium]|nr:tetratricopeptide repeat protein [Acidobacteriota bacterium]